MKTHSFTAKLRPRSFAAVSVACSLAALLPSCVDAEPRDLGFTQSSDELSVDEPSEPFVSASEEFVGRWVGGAQEPLALTEDGVTTPYEFPSGSTRIEVELALDEQGVLAGRIVFGAGEPLLPPVDAEAGYPVGVAYGSLLGYEYTTDYGDIDNALGLDYPTLPPFEGFEYEINQSGYLLFTGGSSVEVPDGVAVLIFNTFEPLAPWCELQTPAASPQGTYSCAPDLGGGFQTLADGSGASCQIQHDTSHCYELLPEPCAEGCDYTAFDACVDAVSVDYVNCDKLFMCRVGFCECTESACAAPFTNDSLQLRRVGDELIGLFGSTIFKNARGLSVPLGEVRLRLQP